MALAMYTPKPWTSISTAHLFNVDSVSKTISNDCEDTNGWDASTCIALTSSIKLWVAYK